MYLAGHWSTRMCGVVVAVLSVLVFPLVATAEVDTIDFEDPPYAEGNLAGQDEWVKPPWYPTANGTVTVSATDAIAGSQSVRYEQQSDGGFSDIVRLNALTVSKHGTSSPDLRATVQLQADANGVGNGVVGFYMGFNGLGGSSPVFVVLQNANSGDGLGYIQMGTYPPEAYYDVGSYTAGNVMEFLFEVDMDDQEWELSYRDLTAGETDFTAVPGDLENDRWSLFGGVWNDTGDGLTHQVDLGLWLRNGQGAIDNITLSEVPEPSALVSLLLGAGGVLLLLRRRWWTV